MSGPLGSALSDLAGEARDYTSSELAVACVRRNVRRRRFLGTASVLVLVLVVLTSAAVLRWPHLSEVEPAEPQVSYYPAVVAPPANGGEPLPKDRGVGYAAFAYADCSRVVPCPQYLVLPDGSQFSVGTTSYTPQTTITLSPDGRYLGGYDVTGYQIRDLLSTSVVTVRVDGDLSSRFWGVAWSPAARRLLVGGGLDSPSRYAVVTLDGSQPVVQVPPLGLEQESVVGVLDTGEIVTAMPGGRNPVRIAIRDAATLELKRSVVVDQDNSGLLRPYEIVGGFVLSPCGCAAKLVVWGGVDRPHRFLPRDQAALIGIDLSDGHFYGRNDMPTSGADPGWLFTSSLVGGLVLTHWTPTHTEIVVLNDINGALFVVSRLPVDALVIARGTVPG